MTTEGELGARVAESVSSRRLGASRWRARAASLWDARGVVPLTLAGGVLTGFVEALLDDVVHGARAHLDAGLLAGALGLVLGVILAVGIGALGDRGPVQGARAWLERATSRDRAVDRAPVLRLHALVLAMLVLLALWVGVAQPLFSVLLVLQEEELAVTLAVVASSSMLALGALARPFARWLERPLAWIDRRWALPLPPQAGVRYALFVAAPVFALLIAFTHAFGDLLGIAGQLVGVPLVVVGAGVVGHAWRRARPRARALRAAIAPVLLVAWCAGVVMADRSSGHVALERTSSPATALGATLTRLLPLRASAAASGGSAPAETELAVEPGVAKTFFGPPSDASQQYNVVWVIIDALRADEVGREHGGRSITVHLDRLASESIVFERAYSQAPSTSYSIPSMLSGKNTDGVQWQWEKNRPQLPEHETTIAERLAAHGYDTVLVASQFIRGTLKGLLQGYTRAVAASGPKKTKRAWGARTAPLATVKSLAAIGELAPGPTPSRPFFLTVYYGEPHSPYVKHAEFGNRFPNTGRGRYWSEIAFTDVHLGQLLEHLRSRTPLWERTIVIVTADHGEAFGEHGRRHHGGSCHGEVVHVPLIVRIPGMPAARVETEVALVDLVPTLIELVGAPRDGADQLSGSSLLHPILEPARVTRERPIYCAAAHQRSNQKPYLQRTLRQGGYALFDWERGERTALFHTDDDPLELHDVIADPAHAERVRRMQHLLSLTHTGNLGEPPPR